MISRDLLTRLACPVCLEREGCPACRAPSDDHAHCTDYQARTRCACGGPDKVPLQLVDDTLGCPCCGECYPLRRAEGYVDLRPRSRPDSLTQYADHGFHERLGVRDGPPLLSARVKADLARAMLALRPTDPVLDLGCGAGKMALHVGRDAATTTGLDAAPFFLPRAVREIDLVAGDLRRLPFVKGAFPRAFSLDVLEHFDPVGLREALIETRRILGPEGRLVVYTHAMESSWLARFQRGVNRLAHCLGRAGLIDQDRERLRKSDHHNAIGSHEHFDALCAESGLAVVERRYYNVVFKAVIEDLILRLIEQARRRRAGAKPTAAPSRPQDPFGFAPAPGRAALAAGLGLTWVLKLDLVLFGGIRTGPFFGLLEPRRAGAPR